MTPNSVIHAPSTSLDHEPVPAEQSVSGNPTTGAHALEELAGAEIGIWEMSPGVMTDMEADEVFVVLSGSATIEFADSHSSLTVGAGDVVRLAQGAKTTWTVTETLRKIYVVPA